MQSSPLKQPIVKSAWDQLLSLHSFLQPRHITSDSAQRVLDQIETFACDYTDDFLSFVRQEQEEADERAERAAALARCATQGPDAVTPKRKLKRMVGPLIELRQRLEDATALAVSHAAHLLDPDSESLASTSNRAWVRDGVRLETVDDMMTRPTSPFHPSPVKRGSSQLSMSGDDTTLLKRIRPSVSASPTDINEVLDDHIPIEATPPRRSYCPEPFSSTPRPQRTTSDTPHISLTGETLVDDSTLTTPLGTLVAAQPPKASPTSNTVHPWSERYIVVTPPTRYQAYLNKHVSFHAQYELAVLLARKKNVTLDDFDLETLDQLKDLLDSPTISPADLIRSVQDRKRTTIHPRQFTRSDSSSTSISFGTTSGTARTVDRMTSRIRMHAKREEQDVASGALAGLGSKDRDWPFGGQIAYSILLDSCKDVDKQVALLQPKSDSPTLARNHHHRDTPNGATLTSGPIDAPDNPLGILAASSTTTKSRFPFSMELQPAKLANKSYRLARRYGSRRVIQLKISKQIRHIDRVKIKEMLQGRVLLILGRTYEAFWATPEGDIIHAVETGVETPPGWRRSDEAMPRLMTNMHDFNDPRQKPGQAMAKWAARPQLLFSDTLPVCTVAPDAVIVIDDIIAACVKDPADPPAEQTLTDGCGLMSRRLAEQVRHYIQRLGLASLARPPSAIQMRYAGSKGLLLLMSGEQESLYPGKDIILRKSMVKSHPDPSRPLDPSMMILDLVQHSQAAHKISTALSAEPMTIMQAQGVPRAVFIELQKAKLQDVGRRLSPLPQMMDDGYGSLMETEDQAARRLRSEVFALGGVGMERKKRTMMEQGHSLKVAGLAGRFASTGLGEEELDEDDSDSDDDAASGVTGLTSLSAQSSMAGDSAFGAQRGIDMSCSPAEILYETLSSGYTPAHCPFTRSKLRTLVDRLTSNIVRTFKVPLERSLTAFIVPDPTGLLLPNEIYISLSSPIIDSTTGTCRGEIIGNILALRSPCKLPADVQKMKAVSIPELAHLTDVIVMSANADLCKRSPASMLGGGDYDGDTVQIIWEPILVDNFQNADPLVAEISEGFVEDNFARELVKVQDVLDEGYSSDHGQVAFQAFLLGGLEGDILTSKYSEYHGNAVYRKGIAHPDTLRLARMFCHVLDARKSGLTVRKDILKADAAAWGGKLGWRDFKKGKTGWEQDDRKEIQRSNKMGAFILDELQMKGKEAAAAVLSTFEKSDGMGVCADLKLLAQPWFDLVESFERTHGSATLAKSVDWSAMDLDFASSSSTDGSSCGDPIRTAMTTISRHVCAVIETYKTFATGPVSQSQVYGHYAYTKENLVIDKSGKARSLVAAYPVAHLRTPTRRPQTPDAYKTKEERKKDVSKRNAFKEAIIQLWHGLPVEEVEAALMGQGRDRLRELMLARAAGLGKFASHVNLMFELDLEMMCSIRAKASVRADGKTGSVVRLRDAWEDSRPSRRDTR